MPEVNVEINGRKYRMACEEGQEQHLLSLAQSFNQRIDGFKDGFGEIGDNRLTVMAGIAVLDELAEAHRRIEQLKGEAAELAAAGQQLTEEFDALERNFAQTLNEASRRLEAVANAIDETGAPGN
jgi:cell division protein ZapA